MICVLDVNVAFEIAFNGSSAEKYKKIIEEADKVIVPELFTSEVTNVMWQYLKANYIDEENAKTALTMIFQMADFIEPAGEYSIEALHEASRLNHSAYDMYYFCLARHNAATLLTMDKKLASLCTENGVNVM